MGKLIVLEGLGGSGKATQTALLAKHLTEKGLLVRQVSFPDYKSNSSALVQMYLVGDFGSRPDDVNAYAAASFYAVDRFASWRTQWGGFYREGGVVVADRYTTSNYIHQSAKLPEAERAAFVEWLDDYEYNKLGIPRPDKVIYLDVEPQVSQELLLARYAGDADRKDIHESDIAYLQQCRSAALWCVEHLGWQRIVCSGEGRMRPVMDIARDVSELVKETI